MAFDLDSVVRVLAPHASVLHSLFLQASHGSFRAPASVRDLASRIGLSTSATPQLRAALATAAAAKAVEQFGMDEWAVTLDNDWCLELSTMLKGIALYKEHVHQDADRVSLVLSKPAQPSQFCSALENSLQGFWGIHSTADLLRDLALRANQQFVIMTPFLDADGAERIRELFEMTKAPARTLIVREVNAPELLSIRDRLGKLKVAVLGFRIARDVAATTETFHAKVVCADDRECYVGSSNMTTWSFNYSLEMGFHVKGESARRVAQVIRAVAEVSKTSTSTP